MSWPLFSRGLAPNECQSEARGSKNLKEPSFHEAIAFSALNLGIFWPISTEASAKSAYLLQNDVVWRDYLGPKSIGSEMRCLLNARLVRNRPAKVSVSPRKSKDLMRAARVCDAQQKLITIKDLSGAAKCATGALSGSDQVFTEWSASSRTRPGAFGLAIKLIFLEFCCVWSGFSICT